MRRLNSDASHFLRFTLHGLTNRLARPRSVQPEPYRNQLFSSMSSRRAPLKSCSTKLVE